MSRTQLFSLGLLIGSFSLGESKAVAQVTCSNQGQIDECIADECGRCGFPELGGECAPASVACFQTCEGLENEDHAGCTEDCRADCAACVAGCAATTSCADLCVVCDAGGPYNAECAGETTTIALDASGSSDTEGGSLTFLWTTDCPDGEFDDETSATPVLTVDTAPGCDIACSVTVLVTAEDGGTASCNATVAIDDTGVPTLGTPEPLEACYQTTQLASAATCARALAVSSDTCDQELSCRTFAIFPKGQCNISIRPTVVDDCDNETTNLALFLGTTVDEENPTAACDAPDDPIVVSAAECEATFELTATVTDNCCLDLFSLLQARATIISGNATLLELIDCAVDPNPVDAPPTMEATVSCEFRIGGISDCPVVLELELLGNDCCGRPLAPRCTDMVTVVDETDPVITNCPEPITLERGDKLCDTAVQDWLDSATATDNCPGAVTIENDADENGFECGFSAGQTTTVEFTATDACGNVDTCTTEITVLPLHRIDTTQKGSLLVFSKVEIKWDAAGNLTQDTFLDFSNDFDGGAVDVQAFLINGDRTLEEITTDDGTVIQDAEPGWNRIDCRFELTKNQPHYWSAANGSSMCGPFTSLDGDGPGRPDPEVAGGRVLRGYVVMWAVKFNGEYYDEIRWNHLKGDALIINYSEGSAWEYNAWAAQARCGANGAPVLDCLITDANGTCCDAAPIPGNLGLDGFSYDVTYDRLLLDFYATGTTALSARRADGSMGVGISLDTDLTLHSMDIDLRQDGDGPPLSKAEFEVFNQNEVKLSGLRRCICCWDQTMFSDYVQHVGIPNYFLRQRLGTDKGQARIDAVRSVVEECNYCETCGVEPRLRTQVCAGAAGMDCAGTAGIGEIIDVCQLNFSQDTALLGLSTKFVNFENGSVKIDRAGMNLVGTGEQTRLIEIEEVGNPGVAGQPTIQILQYGSRIQYDVPRGTDEARRPVSISQPTRETRSGKEANPVESLRSDATRE